MHWGVGAVGAVGVRAGARGEGSHCESGVGRFQLSAFWGALAAMHRRRHGEGGGGGALSFGVAGRARV